MLTSTLLQATQKASEIYVDFIKVDSFTLQHGLDPDRDPKIITFELVNNDSIQFTDQQIILNEQGLALGVIVKDQMVDDEFLKANLAFKVTHIRPLNEQDFNEGEYVRNNT